MANQYTDAYLMGIKEGRESFKKNGMQFAHEELANLNSTIKQFSASSDVGQMLRGERDFWKNKIKGN